MVMKHFHYLYFLFLTLLIFACDKVDDPYAGGPSTGGPIEGVPRKVLVEDFTGFRCVACPQASETAENLQENVYGEQMVIVGIHSVDFFSEPEVDPDHPGYFITDFRTEAGADYENEFGVFGIPTGTINRVEESGNVLIGFGDWDGKIGELVAIPADVEIKIKEATFYTANQEIEVVVDAILANNISGDYNITLYLVEDSILEGQYDGGDIIEDYVHRHVLRGALNGSWGENIFSDPVSGDSIRYEGSFTLPSTLGNPGVPNPDIDLSKCEVVAYIYHSGFEEYEIIQVEKEHVEIE